MLRLRAQRTLSAGVRAAGSTHGYTIPLGHLLKEEDVQEESSAPAPPKKKRRKGSLIYERVESAKVNTLSHTSLKEAVKAADSKAAGSLGSHLVPDLSLSDEERGDRVQRFFGVVAPAMKENGRLNQWGHIALRHSSSTPLQAQIPHNEQLSCLGKDVVGTCTTHLFVDRFPNLGARGIVSVREEAVSLEHLSKVAVALNLPPLLKWSPNIDLSTSLKGYSFKGFETVSGLAVRAIAGLLHRISPHASMDFVSTHIAPAPTVANATLSMMGHKLRRKPVQSAYSLGQTLGRRVHFRIVPTASQKKLVHSWNDDPARGRRQPTYNENPEILKHDDTHNLEAVLAQSGDAQRVTVAALVTPTINGEKEVFCTEQAETVGEAKALCADTVLASFYGSSEVYSFSKEAAEEWQATREEALRAVGRRVNGQPLDQETELESSQPQDKKRKRSPSGSKKKKAKNML